MLISRWSSSAATRQTQAACGESNGITMDRYFGSLSFYLFISFIRIYQISQMVSQWTGTFFYKTISAILVKWYNSEQVFNRFDNIGENLWDHISNISKLVSQWTGNTSLSWYWKSCEWFSTNLTISANNLSWQKKQIYGFCWVGFYSARNWKQFYWQQPSWLEIGPIDIGKIKIKIQIDTENSPIVDNHPPSFP